MYCGPCRLHQIIKYMRKPGIAHQFSYLVMTDHRFQIPKTFQLLEADPLTNVLKAPLSTSKRNWFPCAVSPSSSSINGPVMPSTSTVCPRADGTSGRLR